MLGTHAAAVVERGATSEARRLDDDARELRRDIRQFRAELFVLLARLSFGAVPDQEMRDPTTHQVVRDRNGVAKWAVKDGAILEPSRCDGGRIACHPVFKEVNGRSHGALLAFRLLELFGEVSLRVRCAHTGESLGLEQLKLEKYALEARASGTPLTHKQRAYMRQKRRCPAQVRGLVTETFTSRERRAKQERLLGSLAHSDALDRRLDHRRMKFEEGRKKAREEGAGQLMSDARLAQQLGAVHVSLRKATDWWAEEDRIRAAHWADTGRAGAGAA